MALFTIRTGTFNGCEVDEIFEGSFENAIARAKQSYLDFVPECEEVQEGEFYTAYNRDPDQVLEVEIVGL